ncbi:MULTISPECIES: 30S ribosomal protein S8 [Gloeobacter]|uniref:Small ribosomal subunit protein uS8 n=2 Tax=Gloeobacter TaxID=33071 RepID=RS8_GLOVI|nr:MULTISPECIES: 30S ribosomal protein S8 [Gloeobacter]Q7NEG6.1 RecName: Full=Small ribosomal subunit protein uS8; AltName: Full=30S ribosomal protein S8 [Gloeobacter violaceus PCC 7421]UFP93523.1 30S ribosomal protein S8 [Gloeobacter morelensis MG652769]BAC91854.1 30S ribosomal protein S8 [Gloeobacter violaceus PCC 7421]
MAVNDTLADMLTRIRNASIVKHDIVPVPSTRMTRSVAEVLKMEGLILEYQDQGEGKDRQLLLTLKYAGRQRRPLITNLKRVSRPGLRVYANRKELPRVLGGIGIAIISTSQGVMTDRDARRAGVGGEVLCYVF